MPHVPGHFEGVEPTFEELRQAALRRVRGLQFPAQQRIAQAIKAAGVRTSGVSLIPQLEQERTQNLAESGVEEGIAQQRLGQLGALESLREQARLQELAAQRAFERGELSSRTDARRRLQQYLIGQGIGTGVGLLRGGIETKFPGLFSK